MLTPRAHQVPVIAAAFDGFSKGSRRQLLHLATGAGKTVVAALISARLDELCVRTKGRRLKVMTLAHREELLDQMAGTFAKAMPDLPVTVMQADRKVDPGARVIVCSAQTACQPRRIDWLRNWAAGGFTKIVTAETLQAARPDLIIVDEAHHYASKAESFVKPLLAFEKSMRLGLTATPNRADKAGLEDMFDTITSRLSMKDGIEGGWLCDMRGRIVRLPGLDLSHVRVRDGDFLEEDLEAAVDRDVINEEIVSQWGQYAKDRSRTLAFAVNVKHAHNMAEAFRLAGISAVAVDAKTPKEIRAAALADFKEGRLRVLSSCGVYTEGTDVPQTDCVLMARPTKSQSLYIQAIGRGSRIAPMKQNCLVLDVVGATSKHSIIQLGVLFGVETKAKREKSLQDLLNVDAVPELISEQMDLYGGSDTVDSVLEAMQQAEETTEEFALAQRPPPRAQLQWSSFLADGATKPTWVVGVGRFGRILVEEDIEAEGYRVLRQHPDGRRERLHEDVMAYDDAFGTAEDLARRCGTPTPPDGWLADPTTTDRPPESILVDPDARWRKKPASEKQVELLKKKKLWREGLTAGEASALLDAHGAKGDSKAASSKQIWLIRNLGGTVPDALTSRAAGRLIAELRARAPRSVP